MHSGKSSSSAYPEIRKQELSRAFGKMAGARLAALPVAFLLVALIMIFEPFTWRQVALGVILALVTAFFVIEVLRFRRRGMDHRSLPLNLGVAVVGHLSVTFATGALESPFIYIAVPIVLVVGIFLERKQAFALVMLQVAGIGAFTWIELSSLLPTLTLEVYGGGPRAGHNDALLLTQALTLSAVVLVAASVGRVVRGVFENMVRRAFLAQEESLRAHAQWAGELNALSGEIAHELKNPLASVKGLAGLLAMRLTAGKDAERISVLRREVDRMQGILEEFLNFSRPLVPLSLEDVALTDLCEEVAELHEGLARERSIEVSVRGDETEVRGDPRKIKQIMINLLQNALEASPSGGVVSLRVQASNSGVMVTVQDSGQGLDPVVADHVFEPGVTTKKQGSGLGLTIARAIARQHGGELALCPRADGGTSAELSLPAGPPANSSQLRPPPPAAIGSDDGSSGGLPATTSSPQ